MFTFVLIFGVLSAYAATHEQISILTSSDDWKSLYMPEIINDSYLDNSTSREARILNTGLQEKLEEAARGNENPTLSKDGLQVVQQLAEILEALWFQQIMVLIDNTKEVHRDANIFLTYLLNLNEVYVELKLMKFNSSGVSDELANIVADRQSFLYQLIYENNPMETSNLLTPESAQGGVVFYAILKAARMLREDTAIIVFTDRRVEDEDLSQLAVKDMLQRSIKLYVIWGGVYPTTNNEDKLLREAALLTGGEFIVGNTERNLSELYYGAYLKNPDAKTTKGIITFYTNITEIKQEKLPIDSGVRSIHLSATSNVDRVQLTTPNGLKINVLNSTDVERFSKGSFSILEDQRYEIQLNTAGITRTPSVGIWRLDVASGQGCSVVVSVQTHLNVTTYVGYKFEDKDPHYLEIPKTEKILRVTLSGKYTDIAKIDVLDQSGLPIKHNISFTLQQKDKEPLLDSTNSFNPKQEVDIHMNKLPHGEFYLRIQGEDQDGKAFSRLSYFDRDRENVNYLMDPLSVEVGAGSELLIKPNQYGKIFFEVTNNRDQVLYVHFLVQDERSLLSRMEPKASWLNPKQTMTVTVTTYAPSAISAGLRNLITFTVSGPEKFQKSAVMYVSNEIIPDNREPRLTHRYSSDCTDILLGNCQDGTWVIEVTAEDRESGLLQLTSSPKGLHFPNGYVSGTKDPVLGIYGGSCCQPKIQLTAIDMMNNRRSYTADAYNANLSAGSISAIVLGVVLIILIIVIVSIVCCKKCKNRQAVDLPTYKGPRSNTGKY